MIRHPMTVTLDIPEEVSHSLVAKFGSLSRAAMETLAAKAYEQDCLSLEQVRSMLALESRWEAQAVLSRLGVWPGTTVEDFRADFASLQHLTAAN
jgi:hypothetical protein